MKIEDTLVSKLRRLSEGEQAQLLNQVETWLSQMLVIQTADIQTGADCRCGTHLGKHKFGTRYLALDCREQGIRV